MPWGGRVNPRLTRGNHLDAAKCAEIAGDWLFRDHGYSLAAVTIVTGGSEIERVLVPIRAIGGDFWDVGNIVDWQFASDSEHAWS